MMKDRIVDFIIEFMEESSCFEQCFYRDSSRMLSLSLAFFSMPPGHCQGDQRLEDCSEYPPSGGSTLKNSKNETPISTTNQYWIIFDQT
jgi:hypothetical protein